MDWPRLKRMWVEARLTLGDEITLEEYAEYHGLSADAVQTRAQNGQHLTYCIDVFLGRAGRRRWEKG